MQFKHPLFITCEGGEGAGKTTFIEKLEKFFLEQGISVIRTREPGGSKLSDYIRQWLLNRDFDIKIGIKAELLLFLSARAQHIEELIKPALMAGKIVLCDRFNDSTIVYQGIGRGLGLDYVQNLCKLVCDDILPDLTFFLDVDPQEGLHRSQRVNKDSSKAGELDRIESESLRFHQLVREGFHTLAQQNPGRMHILNANESAESVYEQGILVLEDCISMRGLGEIKKKSDP